MRFAYADPPYLGCCGLYGHDHGVSGHCWDYPLTHHNLIDRLCLKYDGWALSASSTSLQTILPMCPDDVRVMAWVKPFAVFKPNVNPAYAWEPLIVRGGRKGDRRGSTVRDWHSANITLRKGLAGAKPSSFCRWVLDVLGYEEGDELIDLFPGTGIMDVVTGKTPLQEGLFAASRQGDTP